MTVPANGSKQLKFSKLQVEKLVIWGLVLLSVFTLRHFFFVIFMTFIVSYIMRGVVERLSRMIDGAEPRIWIERVLAVVCFILLLFTLYGVGRYMAPRLVQQGRDLTTKMASAEKSPRAQFDEWLRDSVGKFLFYHEFGDPRDERYQKAFEAARQEGLRFSAYENFRNLTLKLEEEFRTKKEVEASAINLDEPAQWKEFSKFYVQRRRANAQEMPHTLEQYAELRQALGGGVQAFSQVLDALSPGYSARNEQLGFELHKRRELVEDWKKGQVAERLAEAAEENVVVGLQSIGRYIGQSLPNILLLPVEFFLSLLLSFFITFDMPRLRRGARLLSESRVGDVYAEIAPGLVNFAHLMGRAFQAQGVIALVNTILTFLGIKLLGIQNEVFLCAIVFVCSFIPVVGVVLSSIPIAAMAIIQDDGGVLLAVYAIAIILLVHFIETSLLNPKIVGDMLHLHPVLVLAILAIGERFFGVWGLLLGCPIVVYIIRYVIGITPETHVAVSDQAG
jgi:predicted PurR-regulated permease PerM